MGAFDKHLSEFVEQAILQVRTGMMCKVITYDEVKRTADVQPLIMQKMVDSAPEPLPPILDAPVCRHVGTLESGDIVITLAVDRSIDNVLGGSMSYPDDRRHHSLADSVVIGVL